MIQLLGTFYRRPTDTYPLCHTTIQPFLLLPDRVLLIATWFNTLLYTLEIHQARSYFRTYSNHDPPLVQRVVMVCLGLDSISLLAQCACVYLNAVTHWGEERFRLAPVRAIELTMILFLLTKEISIILIIGTGLSPCICWLQVLPPSSSNRSSFGAIIICQLNKLLSIFRVSPIPNALNRPVPK
jgi:hypothetical protein